MTRAPEWPAPDSGHWLTTPGGHRWITDGTCLLRSDCPALPSAFDHKGGFHRWKVATDISAAKTLTSLPEYRMAGRARFHPRFAPILQATQPKRMSAHRLLNGEVVAVVMPLYGPVSCPTVDERGRP